MRNNKIGILTFHRALNYGALFQTYALQETLIKLDVDAKVIDYRAEFNEKRFQKSPLKKYLKPREMYGLLFYNSYQRRDRKNFSDFYDRLNLTEVCRSQQELVYICEGLDAVVVGSDQVWNLACTEGNDSYFLPFIDNREKKKSYAASFGYTEIPEQFKSKYRECLKDFSAISVREKSGVQNVKKLTGIDAEYVVDPTLLIKKDQWYMLADLSRVPKYPYVLLYLMSEDKKLIEFARKLAKEKGCKILYINDRLFKLRGAENLQNVTPEQWLGLFQRADYICTNSFHGIAFSINMEKNFYVRYISRSIANSRLESILKEYNLENRQIGNCTVDFIDYKTVNAQLNKNREKSLGYIKEKIIGE